MDVREKLVELLKEAVAIQECGFGDPRPTYEMVASYLIANGVTVQEWIQLSEQKPNRDDRVIVLFEGMKDTPAEIQIMYGWCIGGSASHWMPLPQPPKGE